MAVFNQMDYNSNLVLNLLKLCPKDSYHTQRHSQNYFSKQNESETNKALLFLLHVRCNDQKNISVGKTETTEIARSPLGESCAVFALITSFVHIILLKKSTDARWYLNNTQNKFRTKTSANLSNFRSRRLNINTSG